MSFVLIYLFFLFADLQNYILHQFGPLMDKQTWTEEEHVSKQELRSALLETACSLNEENCTQQAKALFKQYVESNGTLRYDLHVRNFVFELLLWITSTAG